jgi:hypothetical protein
MPYNRFGVILGDDSSLSNDSVVNRQLVDTQTFQSAPLVTAESDLGRKDGDHPFPDFAHRSVDGVDKATSKVNHSSHQIGVGSPKVEQNRYPIANAIGEDLGIAELLDNQDVGLNVDGAHCPDR